MTTAVYKELIAQSAIKIKSIFGVVVLLIFALGLGSFVCFLKVVRKIEINKIEKSFVEKLVKSSSAEEQLNVLADIYKMHDKQTEVFVRIRPCDSEGDLLLKPTFEPPAWAKAYSTTDKKWYVFPILSEVAFNSIYISEVLNCK